MRGAHIVLLLNLPEIAANKLVLYENIFPEPKKYTCVFAVKYNF